jgi:hypothetical protein
MTNSTFLSSAGWALVSGGALTLLINAGLTPLPPSHLPFAETAALLLGSVGVYLRQAERAGRFGAVAFATAFLGSASLLAVEWSQVFLVRDLALRAPEATRALETSQGPSLYDLGSMIALAMFMLGWTALAISTLRLGILSRWAAGLVIAGFVSIPLLSALLPGVWGPAAGNAVLASGWIRLGLDLRGPEVAAEPG